MQVAANRVRVPDVVVLKTPTPTDDILASPPYICIEIMSPDDTMSSLQERMDDYLTFGIENIWVVDPWKNRGWTVTSGGWASASDGFLRTADAQVAMPLAEVLLP